MLCHEWGVPQKAPRDLPGRPWGSRWPGNAICGDFWSPFRTPFGTLGAEVATPGAPVASPWHLLHHFCAHFCNQCSREVAVVGTGVQQELPVGCKCGFYTVNTDVLRRCAFGAQGAQKASPRAPRDVFLLPFWHLLEHLATPFATRGHFEATL